MSDIPIHKRLLVIGAGPVGLAVAKAFKTHGVPYDHVEADDEVGGNWYHGVYETTHIISSRRTTEYSDFPMPSDYPDFPGRPQLLAYFRAYAAHFGILDRIEFNTKVIHVRPCEDDLWEVTFADGSHRRYKGVAVCNGHHWDRRFPAYPGAYSGEWMHSKDYKSPEQLRGKHVLVIGGGNSACDVASEAARVGASSHISLRRGYWFLPKTFFGRPAIELVHPWMPVWLQRIMIRICLAVAVGDYRRYGLPRPDHRLFEHHPTLNSELLHYIQHGAIRVHPDVRRWDGGFVEFVDGSREAFDLVVCATGYHVSFPFLAPGLVEVKGAIAQVYGGCLVPDYKHLYLIGTTQPRYGLGPLIVPYADLLARLVLLQDELVHPIGALVRAMGEKPPQTHLIDPHRALRQVRRVSWLLPRVLPLMDRRLARRVPSFRNMPLPAPASYNTELRVN